MKRSKSQLNAISYAISQKKLREYINRAGELEIDLIFRYQQEYKTVGGFVRAYGTPKFRKVVSATHDLALNRLNRQIKHGAKPWAITETEEAVGQCKRYLKQTVNPLYLKKQRKK